MNIRGLRAALRAHRSAFMTVALILSMASAAADGLRILGWNADSQGRIQTYTAAGAKSGDPVPAPAIPPEGLSAALVPTLGDVYRVQVGGGELFVRDIAIKASRRTPDASRVCNNPSDQNSSNVRQVNGVAVRCKAEDSR